MKKRIFYLPIFTICVFLLIACGTFKLYYKSFVWAYHQPDSLALTYCEKSTFAIEYNVGEEEYNQQSNGFPKDLFDSLCIKHDDTDYNKKRTLVVTHNHFLSIDLKSITVTSDVDFDETHPAGTPLNDITWFAAISPSKYIRSGYSKKCHWYKEIKKSSNLMKKYVFHGDTKTRPSEHFPVDKRLSECTEDDFELLMGRTNLNDYEVGRIGWLQLLQQPAAENYTITVEIVDSRDSVWRASANTANSEKFYW